MYLHDVASLNVMRNEVGRKKTHNKQSSSYQRNTYRELDPTNNVFPTLTMLPLHQGTNTMCANMPVATLEAIKPPYTKFYRSLRNPITLQQQSNIDMWFNSYIDEERSQNVQGHVFLAAHKTINENQFVLSSYSSSDDRPHVGFLTFTLKFDHLVNSIKKVNGNTAVKTS